MQSLVTVGPLPGTVPGTKPYCRYCSAVFPCAGIDTVTPVGLPPKMRTDMRRILYWPYYNMLLGPTGVLHTFLYYPNQNRRKSVCTWYQVPGVYRIPGLYQVALCHIDTYAPRTSPMTMILIGPCQ